MSAVFTNFEYDGIREGCRRSAAAIVPLLDVLLKPKTVLDVGCGEGWFAAAFADRGVHALGIDLNRPEQCQIPHDRFITSDISRPTDPIYAWPGADLVLCLETAEHLPSERGPSLIEDLCRGTSAVVFSAAIPGQGGHGHINERWASYWAELFMHHGFEVDTSVRDLIWGSDNIEPWYRQNLLLFRRELGRPHGPLDVVHPEIFGWRVAEARR